MARSARYLTFPGGVVQHGGVVLGVNFGAAHAFTDRLLDDPGYLDLLRVAHECNAVTAACLLTRRADYLAVGGMDEARFGVAFNDVDYCLKQREAGKRIVFTPHARLVHAESASRGRDHRPDKRDRFERELAMLRARWGKMSCRRTQPTIRSSHVMECPIAPSPGPPDRFAPVSIRFHKGVICHQVFNDERALGNETIRAVRRRSLEFSLDRRAQSSGLPSLFVNIMRASTRRGWRG